MKANENMDILSREESGSDMDIETDTDDEFGVGCRRTFSGPSLLAPSGDAIRHELQVAQFSPGIDPWIPIGPHVEPTASPHSTKSTNKRLHETLEPAASKKARIPNVNTGKQDVKVKKSKAKTLGDPVTKDKDGDQTVPRKTPIRRKKNETLSIRQLSSSTMEGVEESQQVVPKQTTIVKKTGVEDAKLFDDATEGKEGKEAGPKESLSGRKNNSPLLVAGGPKWTIPRASVKATDISSRNDFTSGIKPTIWSSSKIELVSTLPELSKCTNGISWLQLDIPVLFLDDENTGISVSDVGRRGITMELKLIREFVCSASDLEDSVARPSLGDESSASDKNAQILLQSSVKVARGTYIVSQMERVKSVKQEFNFDSLNVMPSTWSSPLYLPPPMSSAAQQVPTYQYYPHLPTESSLPGSPAATPFSCPGPAVVECAQGSYTVQPGMFQEDINLTHTPSSENSSLAVYPETSRRQPTAPSSLPNGMASNERHDRQPGFGKSSPPTDNFGGQTLSRTPPMEDHHAPPSASDKGKSPAVMEPPTLRIPSDIPPEIRVLVDAYIQGTPITVIASRPKMLDLWSVLLPSEYAYVYVGFFRVRRVSEKRVDKPHNTGNMCRDRVSGQAEWRFRCEWEPSGEEFAVQMSGASPKPWWINSTHELQNLDDCASIYDSDTESTIHHRVSRKEHPNYYYRYLNLYELFSTPLPKHVRAEQGTDSWDDSFPSGWYCEDCGKLNFQKFLRHRRCTSTLCQSKSPNVPYSFELDQLREPQQTNTISHPYNTYPSSVRTIVATWHDDMQTYSYIVREGVVVKHVFTRNAKSLQREATTLLKDCQLQIPLQRSFSETNPYFSYKVGPPSGSAKSSVIDWRAAPQCIQPIRDRFRYYGLGYGEMDEKKLVFNHLHVLAWVTSGSKKGASLLRCKQTCIILMCLGSEAVISVIPKSGFEGSINGNAVVDSSSLVPNNEDVIMGDDSGLIKREGESAATFDVDMDPDIDTATSSKNVRNKVKPPKPAIHVTLVHGDAMILSGDDFEYSVKRSGTTILLIGSSAEQNI